MQAQEFQLPVIHQQEQVDRVVGALRAISGVRGVTGHRATKIFTVQWSDPATWDQIEKTIITLGYTPKYK